VENTPLIYTDAMVTVKSSEQKMDTDQTIPHIIAR